jgi:hypothetical protein
MSATQPVVPTFEEFVRSKKQYYHDESVRLRALVDVAQKTNDKASQSFFSWMQGIYSEIEILYSIIENLNNSDRYAVSISKGILGLNEIATSQEIAARTQEFGELTNILVAKRKEWELEEKVKEKMK